MAADAPAMAAECVMCKGELRSTGTPFAMACGHMFHRECLEEYALVAKCGLEKLPCPKCRATQSDMLVVEGRILGVPQSLGGASGSAEGAAPSGVIVLAETNDSGEQHDPAAVTATYDDEQTEQNGDTQVESTRAEAAAAPADATAARGDEQEEPAAPGMARDTDAAEQPLNR